MFADLDYELVRVSKELVETLLAQKDEPPVLLVGLTRYDDDTCELIFRYADTESRPRTLNT